MAGGEYATISRDKLDGKVITLLLSTRIKDLLSSTAAGGAIKNSFGAEIRRGVESGEGDAVDFNKSSYLKGFVATKMLSTGGGVSNNYFLKCSSDIARGRW